MLALTWISNETHVPFCFITATVPGMAWIATLNGGDVAAFVSLSCHMFIFSVLHHTHFSNSTTFLVNIWHNQVNGYLPVVLLLTIILILPHIFYGVALHYEDRKTSSDVQKSIIGRYFYYQVNQPHLSLSLSHVLFFSSFHLHSSPTT